MTKLTFPWRPDSKQNYIPTRSFAKVPLHSMELQNQSWRAIKLAEFLSNLHLRSFCCRVGRSLDNLKVVG